MSNNHRGRGNVVSIQTARQPASGMGASSHLEQAMLLEWLGAETITYSRSYVDIAGDILAAIWLTWVIEQKPRFEREGRGWTQGNMFTFSMTGQECEQATGITRARQAGCRRQLIEVGILSESSGRGKAVHYTVHINRMLERLQAVAAPLADAMQLDQPRYAPAKRRATGG